MKMYFTSKTLTIVLLFASNLAFGFGDDVKEVKEILPPSHCSHMSKDPRCWGQAICQVSKNPRCWEQAICQGTKNTCHKIAVVREGDHGKFNCADSSGYSFSCTQVVEELGMAQIEGVVVMVQAPYMDACHLPGTCCRPGYGEAKLDQACD